MTKFFIPNLLEYIYSSIISRPKEYLFERLSRADLKKIKTDARIKSFSEKANIEEKLILLSKLNYGSAIIIWDKDKVANKSVKDILLSYLTVDDKDLSKTIIKDKIYACMDIEVIRALMVISKSCSSKYYSVSKKFLSLSHHKEHFKTRKLVSKFEADKNLDWAVNFMDYTLSLEIILESLSISIEQFRIILFLHSSKNGALKIAIKNKIGKNPSQALADLYSKNMIQYSLTDSNIVLIDINGLICIDQVLAKFTG